MSEIHQVTQRRRQKACLVRNRSTRAMQQVAEWLAFAPKLDQAQMACEVAFGLRPVFVVPKPDKIAASASDQESPMAEELAKALRHADVLSRWALSRV